MRSGVGNDGVKLSGGEKKLLRVQNRPTEQGKKERQAPESFELGFFLRCNNENNDYFPMHSERGWPRQSPSVKRKVMETNVEVILKKL